MKLLISGATGLVGTKLLDKLYREGYSDIRILTRNKERLKDKFPYPVEIYEWNPKKLYIDPEALKGVDCLINLAGESIADGRWSPEKKERILSSRTNSAKTLLNEMERSSHFPKKIISASAVGIYGNRANEELTESSSNGSGFLADVCRSWEETFRSIDKSNTKVYFLRIGIVLSKDGGALEKMQLPFKAGIAGVLGDGEQFMSWIHIDDLVSQIVFLMKGDYSEDTFNGVAPAPVTNYQFTKAMGKTLARPTLIPAPSFALKALLGEMAIIVLGSQRVIPSNFTKHSFKYQFTNLASALENIFSQDKKGERKLYRVQYIPKTKEEVFDFFSSEKNLEKITPPYLNFKVLGKDTPEIQEGTIINYELKLHGIPMRWKSLISNFEKNNTFIDQQLKGPYSKWVHQHDFISTHHGCLITDDIVYKVPLGLIGRIFAGAYVRNDVRKIFKYRQSVIGEVFK